MKTVWWRNWISTDHVRDRNKITELFSHGKEKWVLFRFPCISQAKKQLNDSGHVVRVSFHHLLSVRNKVE